MGKPVRTETTVRELDARGDVVKETTTVVTVQTPKPEDDEHVGMYL